jgi:hypothetical protein
VLVIRLEDCELELCLSWFGFIVSLVVGLRLAIWIRAQLGCFLGRKMTFAM